MDRVDDVLKLLTQYGYDACNANLEAINITISSVEQYIKSYIHSEEIPDKLRYVVAEMAAGVFLKNKISCGEKVSDLIDFTTCNIASVSEGDVSVSYNNGGETNTASLFLNFIDRLISRDDELKHFRKLRW